MKITKQIEGNSARLILGGRLDTNASNGFDQAVDEVMSQDPMTLVIDMKDCVYLASSGLRIIVNIQKVMDEKGGSLVITNACDDVMEVFDMTGLTDLLTIE